MLTGHVDIVFRCDDSRRETEGYGKNEITIVPEFLKETTFQNNLLGTIRRESSFKQFNRSMMSVSNHEQFAKLMQ